jgi:hypothetical protein
MLHGRMTTHGVAVPNRLSHPRLRGHDRVRPRYGDVARPRCRKRAGGRRRYWNGWRLWHDVGGAGIEIRCRRRRQPRRQLSDGAGNRHDEDGDGEEPAAQQEGEICSGSFLKRQWHRPSVVHSDIGTRAPPARTRPSPSGDCAAQGRAARPASFATVFMLRAVPVLAAGILSFERPIPLG